MLIRRRSERPVWETGSSRLLAVLSARSVAAVLTIFWLVRIVIPDLVDLHQDWGLLLALLCFLLALILGVFAVRQALLDLRKLAEVRRRRTLPPRKEPRT